MPTDRSILGLQIESRTVGVSEIEKLAAALNNVVNIADASARRVATSTRQATSTVESQFSRVKSLISDPLGQAGNAAESFALKLGKVGLVAAGATVAIGAGAATLASWAVEAGRAAERSVNLADTLGITVGKGEQLIAMAAIAGVEIGGLTAASRVLSETLSNPTSSAAQKAERALRALGISTIDATGEQRDLGEVLVESLDALSRVEDNAKRVTLANALLGRGAAGLQPLIKNLTELKNAVAGLGVGGNESGTKLLAELDDEIGKAAIAWEQFKKSVTEAIAPIVIPVLFRFRQSVGGERTKDEKQADKDFDDFLDLVFAGRVNQFDRDLSDLSRLAPKVPTGTLPGPGDVTQRETLLKQFESQLSSEERLQRRLGALRKQREEAEKIIGDPSRVSLDRLRSASQEFTAAGREIRQLERQNQLLAEQKQLRDQNNAALRELRIALGSESESPAKVIERLTKQVREGAPTFGSVLGGGLNLGIPGGLPSTVLNQLGSIPDLAKEAEDALSRLNERRVDAVSRALDFQSRLVELTAGPGGELAAIERIAELRIESAQQEFEITGDRARLEAQIEETTRSRLLSTLDLERKRLDRYQEAAGRVFDAAISRDGNFGLGDFVRQQGLTQLRSVAVNASTGIFRAAGSTLGRIGEASGLGGLLRGTLFDPVNAQDVTEQNTSATDRNTRALDRNTAAKRGQAIGLGPLGVTSLLGDLPALARDPLSALGFFTGTPGSPSANLGNIPGISRALNAITESSTLKGFSSGLNIFQGGLFAGLRSGDYSVQLGSGRATTASALGLTSTSARIGNVVGSGAALAGAGLGIYSGIQEGGPRGVGTAVSSGLAAAALIPGPQQPFVAAAAAIASLVTFLLGDPKAQRDRAETELLRSRRYDNPERLTEEINLADGRVGAGYDYRGNARFVNVTVNALDARSFLDRSREIGEAVTKQVMGGDARLAASLRTAVLTG